jgi:hypothetical protein
VQDYSRLRSVKGKAMSNVHSAGTDRIVWRRLPILLTSVTSGLLVACSPGGDVVVSSPPTSEAGNAPQAPPTVADYPTRDDMSAAPESGSPPPEIPSWDLTVDGQPRTSGLPLKPDVVTKLRDELIAQLGFDVRRGDSCERTDSSGFDFGLAEPGLEPGLAISPYAMEIDRRCVIGGWVIATEYNASPDLRGVKQAAYLYDDEGRAVARFPIPLDPLPVDFPLPEAAPDTVTR